MPLFQCKIYPLKGFLGSVFEISFCWLSHKLFNNAVWPVEISSNVDLGRKVVMDLGGVVMAA
jgi:hypothetical protein